MILAEGLIFFDLKLPNPTTWFYFSGLLAIALFFKFSRLLSMRNLDVVTLYLFVPGLLLLAEGETARVEQEREQAREQARKQMDVHDRSQANGLLVEQPPEDPAGPDESPATDKQKSSTFLGYLWLMIASLYFLVRCLLDLTLVRKPALGPNLDFSGMVWLAGTLFVSLAAVAAQPGTPDYPEDHPPALSDAISAPVSRAIKPYAPPDVDDSSLGLWAARGLALLCHLSIVVALVLIGWRHFDDVRVGMAAATFYLLLPYTFLLLPDSPLGIGRSNHAWAMALVVWAVFTYRRPMLAGAFLGVAAGTALFVLVVIPAWVSFYYQRGATRFLLSFIMSAGLGLAVLGGFLWLNGELPSSLQTDWTRFGWQPWKRPAPATPGFWQDMPSQRVTRMPAAYRVPVFLASMTLVVISAFWPGPKNLAHVLALSAAALISIQFWYADRGGVYVLWYLPLLLLLVFRPNLAATQPPTPPADDWVARLGRWTGRLALRLLRRPLFEKVA